jgi:DnaK suppressor protein
MDQKKQKLFRAKLENKKAEVLEARAKTRRHGQETDADGAQDVADMAASASTKEFLLSLSGSEREMLRLVDEALERLRQKRYGTCVSCSEELDLKRLEAVPWAPHCLRCQEMREQELLS